MSLDNLEKKLYEPEKEENQQEQQAVPEQNQEAQPQNSQVGSAWDVKEEKSDAIVKVVEKTGKITKAIFWVMMLVVVGAGIFLYYFLSNYFQSKDFGFDVNIPDKVMVGQPFEITVDLENKSKSNFREPKVLVQLPDGMMSLEDSSQKQVIEDSLDNMNPGAIVQKKYKIVDLEDPQTNKNVKLVFSYLPENINTRFEKEKEFSVAMEDPVIDLNISAPQKVFSGENLEMQIKYKNNSDAEITSSTLKLIYPTGFTPKEFSINPTNGNNAWSLSSLIPNQEQTLSVKGSLQGSDQSTFEIKGQISLPFNGEDKIISEKSANLSISSSPLAINIIANSDPNYVARPGQDITYNLNYKNNTDVSLSDAIIKAQVKGEMFDFSRIQTNGVYDAVSKTITWNVSNAPDLKNLAPGAEGSVSFVVGVKGSYPIKRMFDKNFTLKASAEINSPTVPYNVSSDRTVGQASLVTKIIGDYEVSITSVKNMGFYPPKATKKTTYTIYIRIKNYATDLSNLKLTGILSPESKFVGNVKSNVDSSPQVNDRTGEISWEIPSIIATKGVIGNSVEGSFQIDNTPSVTQIGNNLQLISNLEVTATDSFTGQPINKRLEPLITDSAVVK